MRVSHLQGHELDLTHRLRGGTATVGVPPSMCVCSAAASAADNHEVPVLPLGGL